MRIVFITKKGWLILLAICVFVVGNIILLYRFVNKHSASFIYEDPRLIQISDKYLDNVADEKLKGIVKVVKQLRKRPSKSASISQEESVDKFTSRAEENREKDLTSNLDGQGDTGDSISNKKSIVEQKQSVNDVVTTNLKTTNDVVAVILVMACNRPTVKRCLDLLLRHRPSAERFPIVVSQDCGHEETAQVILSYGTQIRHIRQPDLSYVQGVPSNMRSMMGYYKISRHYKWALTQVFDVMEYDTTIVVEDDLDVALDFFEYFTATKPLLAKDPSLWCISAWNDNGKEGMVERNDALYRTDFFPGLGWMITKALWNELKPKWPLGFWDDWMREPAQRKDRACIRPEIPRTRTFGRIGVSHGQFYDQHLQFIKLNDKFHPFTKTDLSYLVKDNYDRDFITRVHTVPLVTVDQLVGNNAFANEVQIHYSSKQDFEIIAKRLGAMTDFKGGIPRMSYLGVVSIVFQGKTVHLVS